MIKTMEQGSGDVSRRHFLERATASAGVAGYALATDSASATQLLGPDTAGKSINMGVVGGGFGRSFPWHMHPNGRVTAVCDVRTDRLKLLMDTYNCKSGYRSYLQFLKHPGLDAVAVFTPTQLHAWMAIEAMKAGKHVVSAVPAGMTAEELERLIESVKKTGMRYMMAETSRFRPEIMTCVEWSKAGKFGTIFYTEAEYHHEGLITLMFDDQGLPTWRHGLPPLLYPTHSTGAIIPVIRERFAEVQAVGWGDGHEVLQTNQYNNPFWNSVAFFKTSAGHCSRISIFWHVAVGGTERASFYGDKMSYIMTRPEGSPNTVARIGKDGETVLDEHGYPRGKVSVEPYTQSSGIETLPEPLRSRASRGPSQAFVVHEFLSALIEGRHPVVDVWEAAAYTIPGIVAHQSALRGGEPMKIRDYGKAAG